MFFGQPFHTSSTNRRQCGGIIFGKENQTTRESYIKENQTTRESYIKASQTTRDDESHTKKRQAIRDDEGEPHQGEGDEPSHTITFSY